MVLIAKLNDPLHDIFKVDVGKNYMDWETCHIGFQNQEVCYKVVPYGCYHGLRRGKL